MVVLTEDSPLTKLVKKGEAEQLARTKGPADRRRPLRVRAAALRAPRAAHRPVVAACRRGRARRGRGAPGDVPADAQPSRQDADGRAHRRPRARARRHVLQRLRPRGQAARRRARLLRRHHRGLRPADAADPPGVRALRRRRRRRGSRGVVSDPPRPGLLHDRQDQLPPAPTAGAHRARLGRPHPRARARAGAPRARVDRPGGSARARAPTARRRPALAGPRPAEVRRGLRPPDDPRAAAQGRRVRARHAAAPTSWWTARRLRRAAPLRGPTAGQREIGEVLTAEARLRPTDAPGPAGRGRLGQDRRRAAGDARSHRRGRAGRPARPHGGAGSAAPPLDHGDARRPRPRAACSVAPSTARPWPC